MFLERYSNIKTLDVAHNLNISELYEAIDNKTQNHVVIKARSQIASNDLKRKSQFQHEITIAHKLDHPCILPLIDYGEGIFRPGLQPVPYIVYPFIRNGSLAKLLTQRPYYVPWSLLQTANVILQVGSALHYLHQLSPAIIHRDVRPDNFLIRLANGACGIERVFLCDFGIAMELTSQSSLESPQGNGQYMAPEQFIKGGVVCQSDQYVLACIANYLLTENYPLKPSYEWTWLGWRDAHTYFRPTLPGELDPESFSPEIDAVLLKALDKKPEQRFPSVWDFASHFYGAIKKRTGEALPETLLTELAPTNYHHT
jgi:serine/threonine protein kinase